MRKRLSENSWLHWIALLSLLGFFAIMFFSLDAVTKSEEVGVVTTEFPVVSIPVEDPTFHTFSQKPAATISKTTPMVVLTTHEIFFGDVEAFSTDLYSVTNKFTIKHRFGAPDLNTLTITMEKWFYQRMHERNLENNGLLIFLPVKEIPVPIVIETLAGLKQSPMFKRVILAGGII